MKHLLPAISFFIAAEVIFFITIIISTTMLVKIQTLRDGQTFQYKEKSKVTYRIERKDFGEKVCIITSNNSGRTFIKDFDLLVWVSK